MILEIVIIVSLVLILIVLGRRLPDVIKLSFSPKKSQNILESNSIKKENFWGVKKEEIQEKTDMEMADEYFEKGDFGSAERFYVKSASHNPDNPKIYNRLGIIYLEQKNFRDAKDAFYEALKHDKKKASRHVNYGLACLNLRNYDEAIKSLETAVKLEPKNEKYNTLLKDAKAKKKLIEKV